MTGTAELEEQVRQRFDLLRPVLDERQRRLWAAAEAAALGYGGGAIVTRATGIRSKRISGGRKDLQELRDAPVVDKPRDQRVRRPGAGRKPIEESDPTLWADLESLVEPLTRGDPESALRWTTRRTPHGRGERAAGGALAQVAARPTFSHERRAVQEQSGEPPERSE